MNETPKTNIEKLQWVIDVCYDRAVECKTQQKGTEFRNYARLMQETVETHAIVKGSQNEHRKPKTDTQTTQG